MTALVQIQLNSGETRMYPRGTALLQASRDFQPLYASSIVAARVNNEVKGLLSRIDKDCIVDFLDLNSETGIRIYQRSLVFIMIAAAKELFPGGEVTVEHSLSKGLYCELHIGRDLTVTDIALLKERMWQIVKEDWPIKQQVMSAQEAIEIFSAAGYTEKVKLMEQLDHEEVTIYSCGSVQDYMYGTMVPSAGYLSLFDLKYYQPGLIMLFPEKENPQVLPQFVEQPKLAQVFLEAEQWGNIMGCGYVAALNENVQRGEIGDIIRIAEALHEKKLAQIADHISDHRDQLRVILVAGPSSSGKTTFAQRLRIQLRVNDMRPVPISLDDYFVNRECTPRDEQGNYDFESIEAIDLALFNEHLTKLLAGEAVEVPTYNFISGQREYRGKIFKISQDQPLIIEGIHGLNERLTASISRQQKLKIYISALTQLSIDNHNRIPTTDTRLIRRMVRDSQFRGHDALKILELWTSVRRGEEKYIFPFQEEADIMFNSALIYELGVLKRLAEPLLKKVTAEYPQYSEAQRLLKFLSYFYTVEDTEIPYNSILREFIGKSCFCV